MSANPSKTPVIVRDYNGHYRIEREDLDELIHAEQEFVKLRKRILELENENANLVKAFEKAHAANTELGHEISELRWTLKEAYKMIDKLTGSEIEVEYIVI